MHRGHQYLFDQLHLAAQQRGLESLVVTFAQHPRQVLQSDYIPQLLTTLDERLALIRSLGHSADVEVLDFSTIHELKAAEFMRLLRDQYDVSALLMGYDHCFGSDRLHRAQDYQRIGQQEGIEVITMSEFSDGELHISSTEIRLALERGNILLANELLGRSYSLTGTVVHGKGLGRTIGFPTANIQPDDPYKIIPKPGVYGVHTPQPGICNIDAQRTIEVHIPHFEGDLYGSRMTISFERYMREERPFKNMQELKEQIKEDLATLG